MTTTTILRYSFNVPIIRCVDGIQRIESTIETRDVVISDDLTPTELSILRDQIPGSLIVKLEHVEIVDITNRREP